MSKSKQCEAAKTKNCYKCHPQYADNARYTPNTRDWFHFYFIVSSVLLARRCDQIRCYMKLLENRHVSPAANTANQTNRMETWIFLHSDHKLYYVYEMEIVIAMLVTLFMIADRSELESNLGINTQLWCHRLKFHAEFRTEKKKRGKCEKKSK